MRRQFHQSFMDMLWRCELQAMYRYLLNIRRPPRAFVHVGSSTHEGVRVDLQNKIDTGELMTIKDTVDFTVSHYDDLNDKYPIELDVDEKAEGKSLESVRSENRDKTATLANLHRVQVAPIIRPAFVEHPFSINMDKWLRQRAKHLHRAGDAEPDSDAAKMLHAEAAVMNRAARLGVDFAGTRDIIEQLATEEHAPLKKHRIRDTKTSGKSPSKGIADASEQLDAYALVSLAFQKELPQELVLDYLVYTPKKKKTYHRAVVSTRTQDDVNVFLYRFARAVHRWHTALKSGDFAPARPTDWWCSEKFCAYADRCPAFKRPKLVQIGAPEEDE